MVKVLWVFCISFVLSFLHAQEPVKIVEDSELAVMWLDKEYSDNIFKMAGSICKQESFGGKSDWRLPTVQELQKLAKDKSIKKEFHHIYDGLYWSKNELDEFSAYAVYIGNGFVSENDKCDKYLFLCVRESRE
jgi:hypothetical protein